MLILISALIIDTMVSIIYDLIGKHVDSNWGVIFFIVISAIILTIGLVLLLRDIKKRTELLRTTNSVFNKLYKLTVVVQFLLIVLFIFMVIQMILTSQYFAPLLVVNSVISSIPFYLSFGILAQRFFSWYRSSSKQNIIIFLYGIAIAFSLIGNFVLDTAVATEFSNAPMVKKSSSTIQSQHDLSFNSWSHLMTPISANLLNLATVLLITSYLFLWIVSAILLYRYSRRIGKSTAYWVVVFLPPIFVLIGQLPTFLGIPTASFTFY